jgi:hypothetical protein
VIGQVVEGQQEGTVGVAAQERGGDGDDLAVTDALGDLGARPSSSCQAGTTSAAATSTVGSSLVPARSTSAPVAVGSPAMNRRISWSEQVMSTPRSIEATPDDGLTTG